MPNTTQNFIDAIEAAGAADAIAEAAYAAAKEQFEAVEAAYRKRRGQPSAADIQALLKKYGPVVAKYAGGPAAGAALAAITADKGAFGSLIGAVKSVIGLILPW